MKEHTKELPKGICPSCWGKKYYTQMNRETGSGDFIGDRNYDSGPRIDKITCSKCKGTGKYNQHNHMEETKKKIMVSTNKELVGFLSKVLGIE